MTRKPSRLALKAWALLSKRGTIVRWKILALRDLPYLASSKESAEIAADNGETPVRVIISVKP